MPEKKKVEDIQERGGREGQAEERKTGAKNCRNKTERTRDKKRH